MPKYCHLSDLPINGCFHCRTGARNLGHVSELLGFDAEDE